MISSRWHFALTILLVPLRCLLPTHPIRRRSSTARSTSAASCTSPPAGCAQEYPHLIAKDGEKFVELMDDLHRALVVKVYFAVCQADRKWSPAERSLAEILIEHLWKRRLTGEELRTAAQQLAQDSAKLKWYALVRPFDHIVPLRDRVGTLETIVMRLANLIARHDGKLDDKEAAAIKSIQEELHHHLRPIPIDEPTEHEEPNAASNQAIESLKNEAGDIRAATRAGQAVQRDKQKRQAEKPDLRISLEDALSELDGLIGLERIKEEVRTLTNYLKLQQRRDQAGLPGTDMSLHMVFTGNPGTGKTTVARILGKIFGAMGVLKKGHLVETDRSGLVAEYMGQTGPRTQAKINEALDGILFIDEAYSLVSKEGQDVYGSEAIQTLLKRAEDDRKRLVVILAGYPDEMDALLKSNPGLSSRFDRVLHFDDYSPIELARIFGWLCEKNHYKLAPARARSSCSASPSCIGRAIGTSATAGPFATCSSKRCAAWRIVSPTCARFRKSSSCCLRRETSSSPTCRLISRSKQMTTVASTSPARNARTSAKRAVHSSAKRSAAANASTTLRPSGASPRYQAVAELPDIGMYSYNHRAPFPNLSRSLGIMNVILQFTKEEELKEMPILLGIRQARFCGTAYTWLANRLPKRCVMRRFLTLQFSQSWKGMSTRCDDRL